jgi:hypothetical protein
MQRRPAGVKSNSCNEDNSRVLLAIVVVCDLSAQMNMGHCQESAFNRRLEFASGVSACRSAEYREGAHASHEILCTVRAIGCAILHFTVSAGSEAPAFRLQLLASAFARGLFVVLVSRVPFPLPTAAIIVPI